MFSPKNLPFKKPCNLIVTYKLWQGLLYSICDAFEAYSAVIIKKSDWTPFFRNIFTGLCFFRY